VKRRIVAVALAATTCLGLLAASPARGGAIRRVVEPLPAAKDVTVEGCPFPVIWNDRGGRTMTTVYGTSGAVAFRRITGTSTVILTNGVTGLQLAFDIDETMTITPVEDGTSIVRQIGTSGLINDPGTTTGTPSFTWYGGKALTTGTIDPRALVMTDVVRQRFVGIEGDVCDMLVTGLKSRH
jgi:hypothetical protein